ELPQRLLGEGRLGLDVEAGEYERHRVLVAAEVVDADLGGRWGWLAPDARDAHAVGPLLLEVNGVETRGDVGVGILGAGDLIEQLRRHGADAHESARPRVLGDHE